jgi:hypothetical protein
MQFLSVPTRTFVPPLGAVRLVRPDADGHDDLVTMEQRNPVTGPAPVSTPIALVPSAGALLVLVTSPPASLA